MSVFPNVPNVPGVPPLPRNPNVLAAGELLVSDAAAFIFGQFLGSQWGIFRSSGEPVIVADSVVTFDFKQDWTISTYPVEPNAFASYDKVQLPSEIRLRISAGGSEIDRRALIDSVAAIAGTLELFSIATPEQIYASVNVTHYDYRRTASHGVGLLVIDVWCIQVRVAQDAAFTSSGDSSSTQPNTKSPSGASPVSVGTVQPEPLSLTSTTVN